jgi:hypothetical protein
MVAVSKSKREATIVSQSGTGETDDRIALLEEQNRRLAERLELLAERGAGPPPRPGRDWGAVSAVIACLIGLLALAVSAYATYVQREQFRAEVWPRVAMQYSGQNLTFSVHNQGTGPASVTAMRVTVGDSRVRSWDDVRRLAGFTGEKRLLISDLTGMVLPPGKDLTIAYPADDAPSRQAFAELLPGGQNALSITVCYCSVLGECWVSGLGRGVLHDEPGAEPRPPDSCPIAASERFGP